MYVIFSQEETDIQGQKMYWSNVDGWTTLDCADIFTEDEKSVFNLPSDDAEWVTIRKRR